MGRQVKVPYDDFFEESEDVYGIDDFIVDDDEETTEVMEDDETIDIPEAPSEEKSLSEWYMDYISGIR
jgi:hypothetical protein